MPNVSVIIPCYNRAGFIPETLDSVLSQDHPNLEVIALDDGSTDGTPAVLELYADRVRTVRHDNMGEQATVNRGIELATGELTMVVNSDDPLLPGAIARLVAAFDADPRLVAAYPDWRTIDNVGTPLADITAPDFDLARMLCFHECHPGPGAMVRTDALRAVGGRDGSLRYVADVDLWLRLALTGPIRRVPGIAAAWRDHRGGATAADRGRAMAAEHVEVIRSFFRRPDLPPELRRLRRRALSWAYVAAAYHAGNNPLLRTGYTLRWALADPVNPIRWCARQRGRASTVGVARRAVRRLRGDTAPA